MVWWGSRTDRSLKGTCPNRLLTEMPRMPPKAFTHFFLSLLKYFIRMKLKDLMFKTKNPKCTEKEEQELEDLHMILLRWFFFLFKRLQRVKIWRGPHGCMACRTYFFWVSTSLKIFFKGFYICVCLSFDIRSMLYICSCPCLYDILVLHLPLKLCYTTEMM